MEEMAARNAKMAAEVIVHYIFTYMVWTVKLVICKMCHAGVRCTADHTIFNGIVAPL